MTPEPSTLSLPGACVHGAFIVAPRAEVAREISRQKTPKTNKIKTVSLKQQKALLTF